MLFFQGKSYLIYLLFSRNCGWNIVVNLIVTDIKQCEMKVKISDRLVITSELQRTRVMAFVQMTGGTLGDDRYYKLIWLHWRHLLDPEYINAHSDFFLSPVPGS